MGDEGWEARMAERARQRAEERWAAEHPEGHWEVDAPGPIPDERKTEPKRPPSLIVNYRLTFTLGNHPLQFPDVVTFEHAADRFTRNLTMAEAVTPDLGVDYYSFNAPDEYRYRSRDVRTIDIDIYARTVRHAEATIRAAMLVAAAIDATGDGFAEKISETEVHAGFIALATAVGRVGPEG